MTQDPADKHLAQMAHALGPYREHAVFVGGAAFRLFRSHPMSQPVAYEAILTEDADVALPAKVSLGGLSLREQLLANSFKEELSGEDRPPVTHYLLPGDELGYYLEFLTPLLGGENRRDGTRDSTVEISGVTAQKLRHLEILLVSPWLVGLPSQGVSVKIPNAASFMVQKLLIHAKRRGQDRPKDILYIHDTIELFAHKLTELNALWKKEVLPALESNLEKKISDAVAKIFGRLTDDVRNACRVDPTRELQPEIVLKICQAGLKKLLVP